MAAIIFVPRISQRSQPFYMIVFTQKLRTYAIFLGITSWSLGLILLCFLAFGWNAYCDWRLSGYNHIKQTLEQQVVLLQLLETQVDLSTHQLHAVIELDNTLQQIGAGMEKISLGWLSNLPDGNNSNDVLRQLQQEWKLNRESIPVVTAVRQPDIQALLAFKERQREILENTYLLRNQLGQQQETLQTGKWWGMAVLGIIFLFFCTQLFRTLILHFLQPIKQIQDVAQLVAVGDVSGKMNYQTHNELGLIARAMNAIMQHQLTLTDFVERIGDGNFDMKYQPFSQGDRLGISLVLMRDKLLKVSAEERRQNWASEGHAKFADILRNHAATVQSLAENLLVHLVKYLQANQGAFFILSSDESSEIFLEQVATYAWERKKCIRQRIMLGEGLVGQVAREGDCLHLTDLPQDYVAITSGMGGANPRAVLLVPLKVNDTVQGVLELAAFRPFEPFEIEFVNKLAESIAATLTTVKTTEQTHRLLAESRQMNDHLRTQEEVLRHNAEVMQALQEEMRRKETELAQQGEILRQNAIELQAAKENLSQKLDEALAGMKLQILQVEAEKQKNIAILEGCVDGVVTFDQFSRIEFFNKAAEEIWGVSQAEVLGKPIQTLVPLRLEIHSDKFSAFYQKNTHEKAVSVRTEMAINRLDGEEIDVLMTLTHAQIGQAHTFTAFVQRVSVELF